MGLIGLMAGLTDCRRRFWSHGSYLGSPHDSVSAVKFRLIQSYKPVEPREGEPRLPNRDY